MTEVKQPTSASVARGGSLAWSTFLGTQCPALHHLITDTTGQIDHHAVQRLMERLELEPCDPSKEDCLERQCSALWQYYVRVKNRKVPVSGEVRNISDHLFSERGNLSYKPGDLSFLYDLHRSTSGDRDSHRIVRRAGEAVLKVESETDQGEIQSYDILRFLCAEHPELSEHFVQIYALERTVRTPTKMYVLMESMDGSVREFHAEFSKRDPQFWNRFNRMLIHGLVGLQMLHHNGFSFGHVSLDNLMFKLEWPTREDHRHAGLVAVKWRCPRGMSTEPSKQHEDLGHFALMICELLWGHDKVPKTFNLQHLQELQHPNPLQPLSTVAAHVLMRDENHWDLEMAIEFIKKHQMDRGVLAPLPLDANPRTDARPFELGERPIAYPDW